MSVVAHSIQMLSDDMPFGGVSQMLILADAPEKLFEIEATYSPEYKDGVPTGRRFLDIKMRRVA